MGRSQKRELIARVRGELTELNATVSAKELKTNPAIRAQLMRMKALLFRLQLALLGEPVDTDLSLLESSYPDIFDPHFQTGI